MKDIIKVENISTIFGKRIIHDNISFTIKEGETFGLLGGSGSGKTTLLREMILLQPPSKGDIKVLGKSVIRANEKDREYLRKNWGVLFQFGALFSSLNVLENVKVLLKEYTDLPKDVQDDIAYSKIKMVGLSHKSASLYPSELSGGMKKRVGLARALAMDPRLLFLDEPTSGLDPASAASFDRLIQELRNMLSLTVVMVTHDLDSINSIIDRFILIHQSKIAFIGTLEESKRSSHYAVKKFFKTNQKR